MTSASEKKLFYCTRGWKDGKMGTVHPIRAHSMEDARKYMFDTFGGDWAESYTEEAWLAFLERAERDCIPVEPEVPLVEV